MSAPNYRVQLSFDYERKVFTARAPELDHCSAEGATRAEAIAHLEEEIQAQVQNILASGNHPPAPVDEEQFTGQLQVQVSKQVHRDLAWHARTEGVELPLLVAELLASSLEQRKGSAGRPQQRRAPDGNHNQDNIGNTAGSVGGNANGNGNGGRGRGGFGGGRYNPNTALLDDRANFIEYVRGLEHNTGHQQPRREHGGGGGGAGGAAGGGGARNRNRGRSGGGGGGGGGGRPHHPVSAGHGGGGGASAGGAPSSSPATTASASTAPAGGGNPGNK